MTSSFLTAVGNGYCVQSYNPQSKTWARQCPIDFDFANETAAYEHGMRQIHMPLALKGKIAFQAKVFRVARSR